MSGAGGGFPPFGGGAPGGSPFGAPPQQQPQGAYQQQPQQPGWGGPPAGGFPGAAPAAMPGAYAQAPNDPSQGFVLDIPADPTWQPMEVTDTLEKDGFYQARIVSEKVRTDNNKIQIIMTMDLLDQDVLGKKVSRFMPDPRQTTGDTWFLWRGLMRSIQGRVEAGQQAMRYVPGTFTGSIVYIKTEAYLDSKHGNLRTGVQAWSTRDEWEEACKSGRHRWPAKAPQAQNPGVGALPGGTPSGFGLPGGGALPGAPAMTLPGASASVPQPTGAPMQQAAPPAAPGVNPFGAPPQQPAQPAPVMTAPPPAQSITAPPAAVANPFAAPTPAQGNPFAPQAQAPAPGWGAPPAVAAPPGTNGVPQPNAAGVAASFPAAPK